MAGMAEVKQRGRPSKSGKVRSFVCEVVPPALTSKLVFQDSLNKGRGFWFTKLELDLAHELQGLERRGLAVELGGKWVLTVEGAATVKAGGVGKGAAA